MKEFDDKQFNRRTSAGSILTNLYNREGQDRLKKLFNKSQ